LRLRERFRVWLTGVQGRLGDATGYATTVQEILALAEQGGLENSVAMMQAEMVDLALLQGDAQRAVEMGHKAMNSLHRLGMTSAWGMTAAYLCSALALCGQLNDARASACNAQPVLSSIGLEGLLFAHVALWCARAGRPTDAARLSGCAQSWYAANHNAPDATMERLFGLVRNDAEAVLGRIEFESLRADGAALTGQEPYTIVRSVIGVRVQH
jgi:hypothetical protein